MKALITNISRLLGVHAPQQPLRGAALGKVPSLENAWLFIEDGIIAGFGQTGKDQPPQGVPTHDAGGCMVLPAWCDPHTHLVFAATRESEFVDKIKGLDYATIASKGGGILNSARKLQEMSEEELFALSWKRLEEVRGMGTAALEIKSGYGLTTDAELKMLRVIRKLRVRSGMPIRSTFLGAHAYPENYRDDHERYLRQIEEEMLPAIAAEGLADYIDVFCEKGFFSVEESERICRAGMRYGLKPRLHANQLGYSGGVELGVKLGAISVDHLENVDENAIQSLAASSTIGTLLPTAAFFLRMPFQPARQIINAGAAVALASDYNPGSSPSGNMNLVVSMACICMRMLPEEAFNAATINAAFALEWGDELGSIAIGKKALLNITDSPCTLAALPYAFGQQQVKPLANRFPIG